MNNGRFALCLIKHCTKAILSESLFTIWGGALKSFQMKEMVDIIPLHCYIASLFENIIVFIVNSKWWGLILLVSFSLFPTIGRRNMHCKQRSIVIVPMLLSCVITLVLVLATITLISFTIIERGEIRTLQDRVSALEKKYLNHLHNISLSTDEIQLKSLVTSLNESKIEALVQLEEITGQLSTSLRALNNSHAAEKRLNEKVNELLISIQALNYIQPKHSRNTTIEQKAHQLSSSIETLNCTLHGADRQPWNKTSEFTSDIGDTTVKDLNDSLSVAEV